MNSEKVNYLKGDDETNLDKNIRLKTYLIIK